MDMWSSEDNVVKLVLSLDLYMALGITLVDRLVQLVPLPTSHLAHPFTSSPTPSIRDQTGVLHFLGKYSTIELYS